MDKSKSMNNVNDGWSTPDTTSGVRKAVGLKKHTKQEDRGMKIINGWDIPDSPIVCVRKAKALRNATRKMTHAAVSFQAVSTNLKIALNEGDCEEILSLTKKAARAHKDFLLASRKVTSLKEKMGIKCDVW